MFYLVLLSFALSQASICFYKEAVDDCPSDFNSFSVEDFVTFTQKKYTDQSIVFKFTTDMKYGDNKELVIDFTNFEGDNLEILFVSESQRRTVFVNIPDNKISSFSFDNINVHSSRTDFMFPYLKLRSTKLNGFSSLSSNELNADTASMSQIAEISTKKAFFSLSSKTDGPISTKIAQTVAEIAQIEFGDIAFASTTVGIAGTTLKFYSDDFEFSFSGYSNMKNIKITHNNTLSTLSLETVFYGVDIITPNLEFFIEKDCKFVLSHSNFPSNQIIGKIHASNTNIDLLCENTPFSLEGDNFGIITHQENTKIYGEVSISNKINLIIKGTKNLYITKLIAITDDAELTTDDKDVIVTIQQLLIENTKKNVKLNGPNFYSIISYPAEIYTVEVSNFAAVYLLTVNYKFGQASQVIADTISEKYPVSIYAQYVGDVPTDDDVEKHFNETLNVLKSQNSEFKYTFSFQPNGMNGFNSGTHIYSTLSTSKDVSITLDHHLNDFYSCFCYASSESECPAGSKVFTDSDAVATWSNFVRPTIKSLSFYFISQFVDSLDFTPVFPGKPDVYYKSMAVILEQKFIGGQLGQITIDGGERGAQIVINRETSPVMIRSPLALYNCKIAPHSIETINCSELSHVRADPKTIAQFPKNCKPATMFLERFDNFSSIDFKQESVLFSNNIDGQNDVEFGVIDGLPLLDMTTSIPKLTINANEAATKISPRFSHLVLNAPEHVLVSNISSSAKFDNNIQLYNFNGTLKIEGEQYSKVPISFLNNQKVAVDSGCDVEIKNAFDFDSKVDTTKLDTSALILDDAHFGINPTIEGSSKIKLVNANFAAKAKQLNNYKGLVQVGNVEVWPFSTLYTDDYVVDSEKEISLKLTYSLSAIPSVKLGKFSQKSADSSFKFVLHFDESARVEANFSKIVQERYSDVRIPVVCGESLACEKWNVEFSSEVPEFNDKTAITKYSCSKDANLECINLHFISQYTPTPQPTIEPTTQPITSEPTTQPTSEPTSEPTTEPASPTEAPSNNNGKMIGIIVGSVVGGVVLVVILVLVCKFARKKKADHLINSKLLASTY